MTGLTGGLLLAAAGDLALAQISWLLAAACAGFLVWNWAPAKIFMGDVGSGFLGYAFAVLAVASENRDSQPLLLWLVLLSVFVVDASATLLRRALQGERLFDAHRTHAYQLAVQMGHSHRQVTTTVLGLNIVIAACGWLAFRSPVSLLPTVIGVTVAILFMWYKLSRHARLIGTRFFAKRPFQG